MPGCLHYLVGKGVRMGDVGKQETWRLPDRENVLQPSFSESQNLSQYGTGHFQGSARHDTLPGCFSMYSHAEGFEEGCELVQAGLQIADPKVKSIGRIKEGKEGNRQTPSPNLGHKENRTHLIIHMSTQVTEVHTEVFKLVNEVRVLFLYFMGPQLLHQFLIKYQHLGHLG